MDDPNAAPEFLAILINWFPTLVLSAIWLFYFRRSIALQKAAVEEMRKSASATERVAAALEKRS